jgi:hypothetical protein
VSALDLMLLPFELILLGTAGWCAIVLVPAAIGDIVEGRQRNLGRIEHLSKEH